MADTFRKVMCRFISVAAAPLPSDSLADTAGGRPIRTGDMLALGTAVSAVAMLEVPVPMIPQYAQHWAIGVLYGPHGAPDFFSPEFINRFFSTDWEVHYNSNRLGIRLMGPRPVWAPGRMAAKRGCTHPISTIPSMPSAPSTSPAICR